MKLGRAAEAADATLLRGAEKREEHDLDGVEKQDVAALAAYVNTAVRRADRQLDEAQAHQEHELVARGQKQQKKIDAVERADAATLSAAAKRVASVLATAEKKDEREIDVAEKHDASLLNGAESKSEASLGALHVRVCACVCKL